MTLRNSPRTLPELLGLVDGMVSTLAGLLTVRGLDITMKMRMTKRLKELEGVRLRLRKSLESQKAG